MSRCQSRRYIIAMMLILLTPLSVYAAGQVGEQAVDFKLSDTLGVNHTLSNHLGEVVYLYMVGHG